MNKHTISMALLIAVAACGDEATTGGDEAATGTQGSETGVNETGAFETGEGGTQDGSSEGSGDATQGGSDESSSDTGMPVQCDDLADELSCADTAIHCLDGTPITGSTLDLAQNRVRGRCVGTSNAPQQLMTFVVPEDGTYTFSASDLSNRDHSTIVEVFEASCSVPRSYGCGWHFEAYDDDRELEVELEGGTTYLLVVEGYDFTVSEGVDYQIDVAR